MYTGESIRKKKGPLPVTLPADHSGHGIIKPCPRVWLAEIHFDSLAGNHLVIDPKEGPGGIFLQPGKGREFGRAIFPDGG